MTTNSYHPTGSYKLYNPKKKKVIYNRDVKFDELKYWEDKHNQKKQATVSMHVPMENLVRHQDETIPHGEGNAEQITEQIRSKRMRRMPARLKDYHMFPDSAITDEGEFVNVAL